MFTIETFQKAISNPSERRDSYLNSLARLTKLTPTQIHTLTSGMIWLEW